MSMSTLNVRNFVVAAVMSGFLTVASVQAEPFEWQLGESDSITIAELQSDYMSQILVGDKLFTFDDVQTVVDPGGQQSLTAPTASTIEVTGVFVEGNFGLRFNGGWSAAVGQSINTTIRFSVEATASNFYITDAHLWMTGSGVIGDGQVNMIENIFANDPSQTSTPIRVADMAVNDSDGFVVLSDESIFAPLKKVWVVKDITVRDIESSEEPGVAHLSEFYQTFSQIPEPASVALFALGGIAMLARRRQA